MADRIFGRKKSARPRPPLPVPRVSQIGSQICELIYQNNFEDFQRIVNRDNCNQLNLDGTSPMIAAVKTKNYKSLLWLLCCDADVQVEDPNHSRTALHWAVMSAYDEVQMRHRPVVEKAAAEAAEPLEQMANATPLDAIRWLLVFKADVNAADKNRGTPLSLSRNGDVALVLLANGADASKLGKKGRNFTPEAEESIRKWRKMSAAAKTETQEKEKEAMERAKQSLHVYFQRVQRDEQVGADSGCSDNVYDVINNPDLQNSTSEYKDADPKSVGVEPEVSRQNLLEMMQSLRKENERLQAENSSLRDDYMELDKKFSSSSNLQSLYSASQEQLNYEALLEEVQKLQRQNRELRDAAYNEGRYGVGFRNSTRMLNRLFKCDGVSVLKSGSGDPEQLKRHVTKDNCNSLHDGLTLLMMASQLPNNSGIRCVELLVQHPISADVNLRGSHGRSALHFAAEFNNDRVLGLLLDKGAELNAKDSNGDTPLMMAAANNREDAARELISKKAQLFTRNVKGCTAMNIAQDNKSNAVLVLLRQAVDSFKVEKDVSCLGRGTFGEVYRVKTDHGDDLARKTLRLPFEQGDEKADQELDKGVKESSILCSMRHPGILQFVRLERLETAVVNIFTEFVAGKSLSSLTKEPNKMETAIIRNYCRQICEALQYMHEMRPPIIHRDIKGSNIMVTADNTLKLIDFGLAIVLTNSTGKSVTAYQGKSPEGSNNFMAPEIIASEDQHLVSKTSDIWAFGCTLFQMVTGKVPYSEISNAMTLALKIIKEGAAKLPDDPSIDQHLRSFYAECTEMDFNKRKSAKQLLEHEFLRQAS